MYNMLLNHQPPAPRADHVPHFMDEETFGQRGETTCIKSHS